MKNGHPPDPRQARSGGRWSDGRQSTSRSVGGAAGGLLAVAFLVLAVVACVPLPLGVCDGAERTAFAEFPHYGGVDLNPSPDFEGGTCAGFFDVQATHHEVLEYYRRHLRAHGWAVRAVEIHARGELEAGTLGATRGGFTYEVLYETGPAMIDGGTHLAIHVARA